jgi:hypothetical protein
MSPSLSQPQNPLTPEVDPTGVDDAAENVHARHVCAQDMRGVRGRKHGSGVRRLRVIGRDQRSEQREEDDGEDEHVAEGQEGMPPEDEKEQLKLARSRRAPDLDGGGCGAHGLSG